MHILKQQNRAELVRALLDSIIGSLEQEEGERVASAAYSLRHVKDIAEELCDTLDVVTLNRIVASVESGS